MSDNTKVYINGNMHPDLFDGETPIRREVNLEELEEYGLRVYKVRCIYYEPEEETFFIVAPNETDASDKAWIKVDCESTPMDDAEVTEMALNDECMDFMKRYRNKNGNIKTARDLLVEYIEENGCISTQN